MAGVRDILTGAKNGLFTHRSALDIISRNIENAETEGYTRQTPLLVPLPPNQVGVKFEAAKRERFFFLERRMHAELQVLKEFETKQEFSIRIESLFSDSEGSGLLNELDEFLNSFEELSANPEHPALRQNVVLKAKAFSFRMKETAQAVVDLRLEANEKIAKVVEEINQIASDIANLNKKILELEAAKENANELKDQRDLLIRKLSELVDINTFIADNGMINVYLKRGGHVLVDKDRAFSLRVELDPENPSNPFEDSQLLYKVKYVDGKGNIWDITPFIISGVLGGTLRIRDEITLDILTKINSFARQIIENIGQLHSQGVGLSHFKTLTSSYSASDSFTPLNSAGLPYLAQPGRLSIAVYDENGNLVSVFSIMYDPDVDGIANIANLINSSPDNAGYVSATITPDNKLKLDAADGFTFDIYEDTGGISVALGMDVFLVGRNVFDMDVEAPFQEDYSLLATSSDPSAPAGNDVAQSIANLRTEKVDGVRTLSDIYLDIQNYIANFTQSMKIEFESRQLVVKTLETQIQQRSGVSLDEQFIKTIEFQRAFEASARVVRISDEMLLTILGLVGG